jgi:hypothetical protein
VSKWLYNVQVRSLGILVTQLNSGRLNSRTNLGSSIRIRRIKCDEGKPSCKRCTSTGRKCDGYQVEASRGENLELAPHPYAFTSTISNAPRSGATNYELRALQHFQTRTISALSASFDCDFWNTVVLQVSDTQAPVRSAIIAFSGLHESFEKSHSNKAAIYHTDEDKLLALQQYNKAVRQTAQLLDMKDPTSCRVALISCLLFVCLELIQDNYTFSINHLIGGLRMLQYCQNIANSTPLLPGLSSAHEHLKQFFGRIVVQTMFMGDTHFDLRVIPKLYKIEAPARFSTVTEARDALDGLFLAVYPFLHLTGREPNQSNGKIYQHTVSTQLQAWYHLFQGFVADNQHRFTPKDSTGIILLEIHHICLAIMIDTALDTSLYFQSTPASSFLRIISFVETLLIQPTNLTSLSGQTPLARLPYYSFDLGVIGPLFYTAVKCWNSAIRTKVISLLRHPEIPHREGMWSAAMTAIVAQRIIDVQEEVIRDATLRGSHDLDPGTQDGDGSVQPENLKRKVWFDFVRPQRDAKQLKIVVGTQPEKRKERREEVVTW